MARKKIFHVVLLMLSAVICTTTSAENPCSKVSEGQYYDFKRDHIFTNVNEVPEIINIRCNKVKLTDATPLTSFIQDNMDQNKLQSLVIKDSFVPSINNNSFGGISGFKIVNITFCETSAIDPEFMSKFENLEAINLAHNKFEIIEPNTFAKCKKLIQLDLAYNKITSLENILNIENLQKLYMQFNKLEGSLESISKLNKLRVFNTSWNFDLETSAVRDIQWQSLDISYTKVAIIEDCSNYHEEIITSDNKLTSVCKNFSKTVVSIDWGYNEITHFPEDSFNGLDKLEILLLDGNPLQEVGYNLFRDLKALKLLQLQNSTLSRIPGRCFRNLHNLETLRLDMNNLTVIEPGLFYGLDSLLYLDLSNNNFKHFDMYEVYNLGTLNKLYMDGIKVTNFDTDTFLKNFVNLKSTSFSFSNIRCKKLEEILRIIMNRGIKVKAGDVTEVDNINGITCNPENVISR